MTAARIDVAAALCRIVVAAVWIAAGVLKLPDPAEATRAVRNYRLLPEAWVLPVGTALPLLEIAIGALLLLGLAARASAVVSAALLVLFMIGIATAWARGLDIDCGCFGGSGAGGGPAAYARELARDSALLAASVFVAVRGPGPLSMDRARAATSTPLTLEENR